jgi:glutamyl-tRNA synthetase
MNSFSLQNLRAAGIEPMAIVCFLASLGGASAPHITHNLDDLISSFDLSAIHGGARLDEKAILSANHKILHTFPFSLLQQKHPEMAKNLTENEWEVIREAIGKMDDVPLWESVLHGNFSMIEKLSSEDIRLLSLASEFLSKIDGPNFSENVWDELVTFLKEKTGISGHKLIRPLRFAITGQEHGPEMKRLLHIIAKDTILQRINVPL